MLNDWQPTTDINILKQRAAIMQNIRNFFAERNVLEVSTPLLSQHTVTDPHIHSFTCTDPKLQTANYRFLQTSPEYAMKRLLAAGSGPIYQISKAFRYEESGQYHNPEFSLLEWYRPGFNHHDLMDEMDTLLQSCLQLSPATRLTYQQLFMETLAFDPLSVSLEDLKRLVTEKNIKATGSYLDKTTLLQLLLTHCIEPTFKKDEVTFIYDFPPEQAALAQLNATTPTTAARFEVYVGSMELANGFHELSDTMEQQQRFLNDKKQREKLGFADVKIDHRLLQALAHGFPDCAGVALGLDRLVMLATASDHIAKVISFSFDRS